jgi:hypothetical protein
MKTPALVIMLTFTENKYREQLFPGFSKQVMSVKTLSQSRGGTPGFYGSIFKYLRNYEVEKCKNPKRSCR